MLSRLFASASGVEKNILPRVPSNKRRIDVVVAAIKGLSAQCDSDCCAFPRVENDLTFLYPFLDFV